MKRTPAILAACAALLAGGCASVPKDPAKRAAYEQANDPLEPLNRVTFALNETADRLVIKPVAKGYVRVVPGAARDALRDFVSNLNEPLVVANDLLQGQGARAGASASRFALNSLFGVLGFFDVAARKGLKEHSADFGQTFYVWGIPSGPYLVLPLLGPSNPRDAVGYGVQAYLNPFRYVSSYYHFSELEAYGPAIVGGIDERSRNIDSLDAVQRDSVDFYASLRSLSRQNRDAQLRGEKAAPAPPADLYEDPGAAPVSR